MLKAKELRKKKLPELRKLLADKREEVRRLRFEIALKQESNHRSLRQAKREIALILTVINEIK